LLRDLKESDLQKQFFLKMGLLKCPKDSPGFLLLQQIRDESHRFAITSNRKKKNKSIKKSSLDNIKGLGPKKKKI